MRFGLPKQVHEPGLGETRRRCGPVPEEGGHGLGAVVPRECSIAFPRSRPWLGPRRFFSQPPRAPLAHALQGIVEPERMVPGRPWPGSDARRKPPGPTGAFFVLGHPPDLSVPDVDFHGATLARAKVAGGIFQFRFRHQNNLFDHFFPRREGTILWLFVLPSHPLAQLFHGRFRRRWQALAISTPVFRSLGLAGDIEKGCRVHADNVASRPLVPFP